MAYATPTQLATHVGSSVALPSTPEQLRLLERASEHIDYITLDRVDSTSDAHMEATKNAVLSQVEYWLLHDEISDIGGVVSAYSVGSVSVNFGGGKPGTQGVAPRLAPRARSFLFRAGLLYRGVRS